MSGTLRFLSYLVMIIAALVTLTVGLCVASRPKPKSYPKISPVRLTLVPVEQVPADFSHGRSPESPALRIEFRSSPKLSTRGVYPVLNVRLCDDKENQWWEIWSAQIYVGDKLLLDIARRLGSSETYSGYLPVWYAPKSPAPGLPPIPAVNDRAFDLRQGARPLCVWLDYGTGAFNVERTNEIRFEKEQVAAALR